MSTRTPALAALALVALSCAGCAAAGHSDEAYQLGDELAELPGVERADVSYIDPLPFDSADVDLRVRMRDNATPEQVTAVVGTAYDALTDVHLGEEGNLSVRLRDDKLTLRTFESEADLSDVEAAADAAAVVAEQRGRTSIAVMTQDVEDAPHVVSTVLLWLPKGADDDAVDRVRAAVEEAYGDLRVTVDIRTGRG